MKNPFKKHEGTSSVEKASYQKVDDTSWADADSPYADIFKENTQQKNKKKWLIFLALAVVLVGIFLALQFCNKESDEVMEETDFATLSPSAFMSSVEVNGNVAAEHEVEAYTQQIAPVKDILLEEGDAVEKGQIIARLDDKKIRQQLRAREAAYGMTAERAQAEVTAARNRYFAAANALRSGINSAITTAEASLIAAQQGLKDANAAYDDYKSDLAEGFDPQIMGNETLQSQAQQALKQAELNYEQALDEYERNEKDYFYGDRDMATYEQERNSARSRLSALQASFSNMQTTIPQEIAQKQQELQEESYKPKPDQDKDKIERLKDEIGDLQDKLSDKQNEINQATYKLQDAEAEYQAAKMKKETAETTRYLKRNAVNQARLAVETAEESLRSANRNVDADRKHAQDRLSQLKRAQDAAEANVRAAETSLRTAQDGAQTELQSYEDALRSAQVASKDSAGAVELANLKEDLDDHVIRAPISGTITKVYVEKGQTANGIIAKIEDLDTFVVEAELKELDVIWVKRGMRVEVTHDAFEDEVFKGEVVYISPVASGGDGAGVDFGAAAGPAPGAAAAAAGGSGGNTKPTYTVKVAVKDPAHKLYEGMRTQLKIILAEDQGVYGVPQTAVYESDKGQDVILIAKPTGKDDQYKLKEVPVTTSLENDVSVVVEGKGLKDGLRIVAMPEKEQKGQVIKVSKEKKPKEKEKKASLL